RTADRPVFVISDVLVDADSIYAEVSRRALLWADLHDLEDGVRITGLHDNRGAVDLGQALPQSARCGHLWKRRDALGQTRVHSPDQSATRVEHDVAGEALVDRIVDRRFCRRHEDGD